MTTVLDEILPMAVRQIRPGMGSLFTMDLGSDVGESKYLWVYLCGWAIVGTKSDCIDSESPKSIIDDYLLRRWSPRQLLASAINHRMEMDFIFDNSKLRLFPYPKTYGDRADMFRLFTNSKMYSLRYEDGEIKERSVVEYIDGRASASP